MNPCEYRHKSFIGPHFCRKQYWSSFRQFDVVGFIIYRFRRRTSKTVFTMFKVVIQGHQFWYRKNPVCNFLLENNTKLHSISHPNRDYWSNFCSRQWEYLCLTHLFGSEPLNSQLHNLVRLMRKHHRIAGANWISIS